MIRLTRSRIAETAYPATLRVMGSQREQLDDRDIEDLLAELFPDAEPGEVEDFMRGLQNFGRQAAPIAQRVLPGVAQGAAQGGMVGGPWGALAGGVGGGVAGALGGGGASPRAAARGSAAQPPPVQAAPAGPAASAALSGAVPAALGGAPSAAQLLALLSRPETMQALLSLLMSSAGRPTVQVGANAVPAAAFANAIAELAAQVAESAAAPRSAALSDYLLDNYGQPRTDIANPAARAALLLQDLAEVATAEAADNEQFAFEGEWDMPELDDEAFEANDPLAGYEEAMWEDGA